MGRVLKAPSPTINHNGAPPLPYLFLKKSGRFWVQNMGLLRDTLVGRVVKVPPPAINYKGAPPLPRLFLKKLAVFLVQKNGTF